MLTSVVAELSGTQGRYQAQGDTGQAVSLALAVQEAENEEKFNESYYTILTIYFGCFHGSPIVRAVMTENPGLRRTRKRKAERLSQR